MGRLKGRGFKSPLQPTSSRVRPAAGAEREVRKRPESRPPFWKKWYSTARWSRLREEVLRRDGYLCQVTGVPLVGEVNTWNAPIVDHKIPHRGDPELFWDIDNCWSVAKRYHDSEKQRLERRGLI